MFPRLHFVRKVNLFSALICVAIAVFMFREYSRSLAIHEQEIITQFNDIQSDLVLESRIITKFVSGSRAFAENFLNLTPGQTSPWLSHLKYDPRYGGSTLKDLPPRYAESRFGNLTTVNRDYARDPAKKREFNMALELGAYFAPGLAGIPKSPWFYYIGSDFMYLSPYVDPRDFFFSHQLVQEKEFYKNARPENNPGRAGFWTSVYVDEAGHGLMVTYSEPVYEGNTFKGSVSMDVTLDQFNDVLKNCGAPFGTFALFNRKGQILAEPKSVTSADKKISMAAELLPPGLFEAAKGAAPEKLLKMGSQFVYFRDIPELNATFVFYMPAKNLMWAVLKSLFGLNLAFLLCMALLFQLRYFILSDFKMQQNLIQNAKMAALGQMAAGMAHEINNPLAIIKGKATLLLRSLNEKSTNEIRDDITKILGTSERIEKIVKGLKSFSRNSQADDFQAVPLTQLIENTLELCREAIGNRQIKLSLGDIPPVKILGRESQLSQVLLNLINNSMDAVQSSSVKEISIRFELKPGLVLISVRDSGPRIPADVRARLMEPFFTTKAPGVGTGLGLSISLGLIQQHGGKLYYLPSSPETCFVIELPLLH